MAKIKVALASILAGGGHNALRKLLYEELQPVRELQLSQFTHSSEAIDKIHNTATREFHSLYEFCYKFLPSDLFALITLNLLQECVEFLQTDKPDIVISTHFLLSLHFTIAKIFTRKKSIIITCIPDFGRPNFSELPYNKRIRPDYVMVFDKQTKSGLMKKLALPEKQIIYSGYNPRRVFLEAGQNYRSKSAAREIIRQKFNFAPYTRISPDKITVLISGGAGGFINKAEIILNEIAQQQKYNPELMKGKQYFVICGAEDKFFNMLLARNLEQQNWSNIFPFSWLNIRQYSLVQFACDYPILVSIAPATMSELLATDCGPFLIYTTRGAQEIPNLDFVVRQKLGLFIPHKKELLQKSNQGFTIQEKQLFRNNALNFLQQERARLDKLPGELLAIYQEHSLPAERKSGNQKIAKIFVFSLTIISIILSILSFLSIRPVKKSVSKVKRRTGF